MEVPNCRSERLYARVVASVKRQDLLDYLRGDWCRNLTASLRTLHQHCHCNLRAFVWRESDKPSVVIFIAVSPKLCRSRFSSNGDARDLGSRSGSARFIDYPPHTTTDQFNLIFPNAVIFQQIAPDLCGPSNHRPVRFLDLVDQAWGICCAAICHRSGDHRHLEGTGQDITLTDRRVGCLTLAPFLVLFDTVTVRRWKQPWILSS